MNRVTNALDKLMEGIVQFGRDQDAITMLREYRHARHEIVEYTRGIEEYLTEVEAELNRPLTWRERLAGRRHDQREGRGVSE